MRMNTVNTSSAKELKEAQVIWTRGEGFTVSVNELSDNTLETAEQNVKVRTVHRSEIFGIENCRLTDGMRRDHPGKKKKRAIWHVARAHHAQDAWHGDAAQHEVLM